jgi:carotenoid cleavage dioxygenase
LPGAFDEQTDGATHIFKHDLETGARRRHDFGIGRFPGEFVFVPRRVNAAEDDGWLIGFVVDMHRSITDLVIIDARAIEAEPVATITIPHRVPAGFHGNWVAESS